MRTYACGDIHGNYKGLVQALERSPFNPEEDRLITVGDYIDGGVHIQVREVMEHLLSLPNWIGIIGNHDQWMADYIFENQVFVQPMWFRQGGKQTLDSLDIPYNSDGNSAVLHSQLPDICVNFLQQLSLFFVDQCNNCYVHAGWKSQKDKIDESNSWRNNKSDLYWLRDFWYQAGSKAFPPNPYNKVFIGHTQDNSYPEKRGNVWNLDSGAGYNGRITVMDVETEEYWQSDTTPELYENFGFR